MSAPSLPPVGPDWKIWAQQLTRALLRGRVRLNFKSAGDTPSENGIILWDDVNGYPVVSKSNEWRQLVIADGFATLTISSDVTAGAINTAEALFYTLDTGDGVSIGSPASRIVFEQGGEYLAAFSAQVESTSGSTVVFYFWPRVNGVDIARAAMRISLHTNGRTTPVARVFRLDVAAGDYLEIMWAVSDLNGTLQAFSATAFAPATTASTLNITRVRA